jgi:hypothetical protein
MTQSTFPPPGVQPPYGPPAAGAPYGPPQYGPPQYGPPPVGYPPQPPKKKRRTGLIVGSIVTAVVIAGLVVGGILLFGAKTLKAADAEKEVSRIAQEQLDVQLADLRCPDGVEVQSGSSFACTATVEGQDVSFTVTQTDDKGNVDITSDNTYFAVSDIEGEVGAQVQDQTGVAVQSSCDTGGKTVLVDAAGTQLSCAVTNTEDSSDTLDVTATINDDGTVSVEG